MVNPLIGVKQSTKDNLDEIKLVEDESYDSVIRRLIVCYEETMNAINKKEESEDEDSDLFEDEPATNNQNEIQNRM